MDNRSWVNWKVDGHQSQMLANVNIPLHMNLYKHCFDRVYVHGNPFRKIMTITYFHFHLQLHVQYQYRAAFAVTNHNLIYWIKWYHLWKNHIAIHLIFCNSSKQIISFHVRMIRNNSSIIAFIRYAAYPAASTPGKVVNRFNNVNVFYMEPP